MVNRRVTKEKGTIIKERAIDRVVTNTKTIKTIDTTNPETSTTKSLTRIVLSKRPASNSREFQHSQERQRKKMKPLKRVQSV